MLWFHSSGKKKSSKVRIFIKKSNYGSIIINKKFKLKEYFNNRINYKLILYPLKLINFKNFEIKINLNGGGKTSQIFACLNALAKCLIKYDINFKKLLSDHKLLTRDSRVVERKKLGKKKSRKSKQFSKR